MQHGERFNPYLKFYGLFVPNSIAMSPKIPDASKLLLGRLMQFSGQDGKAFPTRKRLCVELGWNLRKLDRAIKDLKDHQLIEAVAVDPERHQSPNMYYFLYSDLYDYEPPVKNDSTPVNSEVGPPDKYVSTPLTNMSAHNRRNLIDDGSFKSSKEDLHTPSARCEDQLNGLVCKMCGEDQFETRSGTTCKNGHGGVEGVKKVKKMNGKKPILAKLQKIGKIVKTPNPLGYSPEALQIITYWEECGGRVHKNGSAVKGLNLIEEYVAGLLMEGLNPYYKVIAPGSELRDKKWTIPEIKQSIHNFTQVKFKPVDNVYFPQFVVQINRLKHLANCSPLVDNHLFKCDTEVVEWADLLRTHFKEMCPDIHMHQKVLLDVSGYLFDIAKKHMVTRNSQATFEQSIPRVFVAYVRKHIAIKGDEQLKYISGHQFLETFFSHSVKRDHHLITKSKYAQETQLIKEKRLREMKAEDARNALEFTDSDY